MPELLLPQGTINWINAARNGMRTKRQVCELPRAIAIGLTYDILTDLEYGNVQYREADVSVICKPPDTGEKV